jgi:spore coat protein U-like protein
VRWVVTKIILAAIFLFPAQTASCCVVTVTLASFGNYDMFEFTPSDTVVEIRITCAPGVPYNIKLDSGLNSTENYHPRRMRASEGNATLNYNLYMDAARTKVWGDGIVNTFKWSGIGKGGAEVIRIYGRVQARQNIPAGIYNDSVIVTVEW